MKKHLIENVNLLHENLVQQKKKQKIKKREIMKYKNNIIKCKSILNFFFLLLHDLQYSFYTFKKIMRCMCKNYVFVDRFVIHH